MSEPIAAASASRVEAGFQQVATLLGNRPLKSGVVTAVKAADGTTLTPDANGAVTLPASTSGTATATPVQDTDYTALLPAQ